jgi:uncharacterized membrane protein
MNKEQFLIELPSALAGLPEEDIEKSIEYYSEMIDDRIEEGLSEEEAVADLGSIEDIRKQILKDTPITKIIKEKIKPKRSFGGWKIAVIIIGFPLWFPLLIAAAAILFSILVSLWAVVISFYAAEAAFMGSAFGGIIASAVMLACGNSLSGLFLLGCSLACVGFGILWIFVCKYSTKGLLWLTGTFVKSLFMKKGGK